MNTVQSLADELGQTTDAVAAVLQQIPGFPTPPKPSRGICDDDANKVREAFGAPAAPARSRSTAPARPERWSARDIAELIGDDTGRC
jgi:hypothetical protein